MSVSGWNVWLSESYTNYLPQLVPARLNYTVPCLSCCSHEETHSTLGSLVPLTAHSSKQIQVQLVLIHYHPHCTSRETWQMVSNGWTECIVGVDSCLFTAIYLTDKEILLLHVAAQSHGDLFDVCFCLATSTQQQLSAAKQCHLLGITPTYKGCLWVNAGKHRNITVSPTVPREATEKEKLGRSRTNHGDTVWE